MTVFLQGDSGHLRAFRTNIKDIKYERLLLCLGGGVFGAIQFCFCSLFSFQIHGDLKSLCLKTWISSFNNPHLSKAVGHPCGTRLAFGL